MGCRSQNKKKVALITLGCPRNLVDSQKILGHLKDKGYLITDTDEPDVAILNTCAFIEDAKQESIDAIVDLLQLKRQGKIKKVIIAGCLAQRYSKELIKEFKEIDAIIGAQKIIQHKQSNEVSLTPAHYTYLKICESCYNNCRFCVIPSIKGKFSSRDQESLIREVISMDKRKVKEINIIGQDITAYGIDLYQKKSLAEFLANITPHLSSVEWIRLLYAYPAHVTDELISVVAEENKICKYMDIPFQHISDRILKSMNRNFTKKQTYTLIDKVRKQIPGCFVRTAFIVGLPGETDKDFKELLHFVKDVKFERLGVFKYSHEEGVPAYHMPGQVPEALKEERYHLLMEAQQAISRSLQSKFLDQTIKVLIDQKHETQRDLYIGRTEFDAPEVDGVVYVHVSPEAEAKKKKAKIKIGDFVQVMITDVTEYDLIGEC